MNILDKIVLEKTNHTKYLSQKINKKKYSKYDKSKYFLSKIESNLHINKNALIAEFKRYSPSIKNFNKIKYIQDILEQYHKSKCCCISIFCSFRFLLLIPINFASIPSIFVASVIFSISINTSRPISIAKLYNFFKFDLDKIFAINNIASAPNSLVSNIKKIKKESGISSFLIGGSILKNDNKIKYINRLYEA